MTSLTGQEPAAASAGDALTAAVGVPPRRGSGSSAPAAAPLLRWGTIAALVLLWEGVGDGPLAGNPYIAPPSRVLTVGVAALADPVTAAALWATTSRFLVAFAITAVLGSLMGLGLGRVAPPVFRGARDVVTILYALPMVPFYPLFVLWLGLGMRSEIAFGVIHGIIPVILLAMTASAGVAPGLLEAGAAMGANRAQRLRSITLPAVLPDLVAALKIGASLSLLGVLLGELMISVDGVGTFLTNQINNGRAAPLDAMVLVVCVGVVVMNALLSLAERRASRWRTAA